MGTAAAQPQEGDGEGKNLKNKQSSQGKVGSGTQGG